MNINYAAEKNPELFKGIITDAKSAGAEIKETDTNKTIIDSKPKETKSKIKFEQRLNKFLIKFEDEKQIE